MAARLYVDPERLRAPELALLGAEARYLIAVLRLVPGDHVTLFDGLGAEADGEIVAAARGRATLRIGATRKVPLPDGPRVTLLCALLKGSKMDWVVQKTTELGVARLCPVLCARSVPEGGGAAARARRWERIAREAARQCGRADVPSIEALASFDAAVDAAGSPAGARRIICRSGAPPIGARLRADGDIVLAVGPEGGFSQREAARAQAAGFATASLGPRTLRAETAAIVACAAASVLAPTARTGYGSDDDARG
ncbi:MAG: RsmE family RNA methyltransferase [Myxococcota bacterium]